MTAQDWEPAATLNGYELHSVLMWFRDYEERLATLGAVPTGQDSALAVRLKAVES